MSVFITGLTGHQDFSRIAQCVGNGIDSIKV